MSISSSKEEKYFIDSNYSEFWIQDTRKSKVNPLDISKYILINESDFILEIGSGEGQILELITRKGASCVGVDISIDMLRAIRSRKNLNLNITNLIQASAENMPFRENIFSKVICISSSWYIPNFNVMLKDINRIIMNKGVFLCDLIQPDIDLVFRKTLLKYFQFLIKHRLNKGVLQILIPFARILSKVIPYKPGMKTPLRFLDETWLKSSLNYGFPPIFLHTLRDIISMFHLNNFRLNIIQQKNNNKWFITTARKLKE